MNSVVEQTDTRSRIVAAAVSLVALVPKGHVSVKTSWPLAVPLATVNEVPAIAVLL